MGWVWIFVELHINDKKLFSVNLPSGFNKITKILKLIAFKISLLRDTIIIHIKEF